VAAAVDADIDRAFAQARTLKTGKPDFRLALTDSQGDQ
jgi:hypothetical protein